MTKHGRKAVVKKIQAAQSGGSPIGVEAFWSVNDVFVHVNTLAAIYDQHGLDKDAYFPTPIEEEPAARKAVTTTNPGGGYKIMGIIETPHEIVWGVVLISVDEANVDLSLDVEARITYDKRAKQMAATGMPGHAMDIATGVVTRYNDLLNTYITQDIQRMLRRNIMDRLGSVALREKGGVYFSPPSAHDTLLKMQAVVESLGQSEMTLLVLNDTGNNLHNTGRSVKHGLANELAELQAELEKFKTKNKREDTLERRVEMFKELRSKCSLYENLLSITVDDIRTGIDDCEQIVKQMLGVVQVRKEEKAAAKNSAKEKDSADQIEQMYRKLKKVA